MEWFQVKGVESVSYLLQKGEKMVEDSTRTKEEIVEIIFGGCS